MYCMRVARISRYFPFIGAFAFQALTWYYFGRSKGMALSSTVQDAMKFTTLIPMRFNDGREVPQEQLNRIIDDLVVLFGGCSDEGVTKGQWLDPKDAQLYRDESRRVSIVCENRQLWEAQQAVIKIGKELEQRVMYFEVRDYDGVQLLEVPPA
jgi:hypothetical protein